MGKDLAQLAQLAVSSWQRACAAAGLDRVTRQEINRGKPSATGALQFEHGKSPVPASYDQTIAVRPDDGSRDTEIAGSRGL